MFTRILLILTIALGLSSCGRTTKFLAYDGPEITSIVVNKGARRMYLMHDTDVMRSYDIRMGFAPEGHKQFEGDGKTPEGTYVINRRNPNSAYHLSLGISYPNTRDRQHAASQGRAPGGDIFIHGTPSVVDRTTDWTAGCIAVSNAEIEEIYAMVPNGTPIFIYP
jgi:murein L,D-transpeptidase YafK